MTLFITNCETNHAYPIGVSVDKGWEINPLFDQDEFAQWLKDQGEVDLEMVLADRTIHQYTSNCPACGEPIILLPDDSDLERDVMNYECTQCGVSNSIELVEPDDEDNQ